MSSTPAEQPGPFRLSPVRLAVGLVVVTVAAYSAVGTFGFINFDDPQYMQENGEVINGLTWSGVKWTFNSGHAATWHPPTWLSHKLHVELLGLFMIIAWGGHELLGRGSKGKVPAVVLCMLMVTTLAVASWLQSQHWVGTTTLWKRALELDLANQSVSQNLNNLSRNRHEKGQLP